jgi:AraC-like DNA-binding protein
MERPENKERLKKINQLLMELAMGKFFKRIERTDSKDELEAIMALANLVAEDLNINLSYRAHIDPDQSYSCTLQLFFVLNRLLKIEKTGSGVQKYLHFKEEELLMTSFESILDPNSQKQWAKAAKEIARTSRPESTLWLTFRTNTGLLLPAFCSVIQLGVDTSLKGRYIITTSHVIKTRHPVAAPFYEGSGQPKDGPKGRPMGRKRLYAPEKWKVRNTGKYITDHMDRPLPKLKELAHQFGINEFKLKRGFKELYGMTVFQYLKEQRLRKAHVLVKFTNIPILTITAMVGFKQPNHLSREFKAKYGYRPTDLR